MCSRPPTSSSSSGRPGFLLPSATSPPSGGRRRISLVSGAKSSPPKILLLFAEYSRLTSRRSGTTCSTRATSTSSHPSPHSMRDHSTSCITPNKCSSCCRVCCTIQCFPSAQPLDISNRICHQKSLRSQK
uniref:Uncharacterized protein n=1 Tax=Ciona savignyi TaxID=51511 RepID=H2YWQ1_CIOSA